MQAGTRGGEQMTHPHPSAETPREERIGPPNTAAHDWLLKGMAGRFGQAPMRRTARSQVHEQDQTRGCIRRGLHDARFQRNERTIGIHLLKASCEAIVNSAQIPSLQSPFSVSSNQLPVPCGLVVLPRR
jgi:hypothetical protein